VPQDFGFEVRKWGIFSEMHFWNEPNEPKEPNAMAAWIGFRSGLTKRSHFLSKSNKVKLLASRGVKPRAPVKPQFGRGGTNASLGTAKVTSTSGEWPMERPLNPTVAFGLEYFGPAGP
jgi:hypothetical protein